MEWAQEKDVACVVLPKIVFVYVLDSMHWIGAVKNAERVRFAQTLDWIQGWQVLAI